jgi:histidyl-tRNA synthetase
MAKRYKALRGMKDLLPADTSAWQRLERLTRAIFGRYGFQEIRTPVVESLELFARSVGSSSDIVGKEMYSFTAGDDSVCLRPENTASVVRAFVEHSLHRNVATGYPERYFYIGPMFRYERPQKGRQRQFHQIGVEVLGAAEPRVDAETIEMADALLAALEVGEREIVVNSVGDASCRPVYREALRSWLEPRLPQLCEDCNRRYDENPLRVLDCKVDADKQVLADAPTMDRSLCGECREHLDAVTGQLDAAGIAYRVDPHIVRGLDYYVRTVFEVTSPGLGAQNAILGGGRYDGLVESLGGPAMPGFGFAVGMERLLSLMPAEARERQGIDLAIVSLGPEGWGASHEMARRLRARGVGCLLPVAERPLGAQLKRAGKAGARYALFVGKDELAAGRFGFKDLASGTQIDVTEDDVPAKVAGGEEGRA